MEWIILVCAGLLEIAMAISLKEAEGFTKPLWSAAMVASGLASFGLLSVALKTLPVGTAYAVWTGIGAAGTAIIGVAFRGEPATAGRLLAIGAIVAGVIGLKLASGEG